MPRLVTRAIAGAFLALAVLVPRHASAQQGPATVPTRLVMALFDYSDSARIVADRVPDGFPAELVPPTPATAVGGISGRRMQTTVFAFPVPASEASKSYEALLVRAGWKRVEIGGEDGGFVMFGVGAGPTFFCRDSSHLSFQSARGATSGSWLRVSHGTPVGDGECGRRHEHERVSDLALPRLVPPDGVMSLGGGGGGGSGGVTSSTRLVTRMAVADLAAHYAAQLSAAGWTVGQPLAGPALATRRLDTRDAKGREWRGSLQVVELAASRFVTIQMSLLEQDDPWR